MRKKLSVTIILGLFMACVSLNCGNAAAEWSPVDTGDVNNDLWAVWGSSATDVYAVGTAGTNLHYDGNPAETWLLLPAISP